MNSLLLIIDMQEGFRYKESEHILPRILILQRQFDGEVLFSQFIDVKHSLFEQQLHWTKFQKKENQQLFSDIRCNDNQIIQHTTYTVLNEELKKYIQEKNITKVYLSGVYTDVCILKTAMDLFDCGIETFIVSDACASLHGESNHISAIESLQHIIGKDHIVHSKKLLE